MLIKCSDEIDGMKLDINDVVIKLGRLVSIRIFNHEFYYKTLSPSLYRTGKNSTGASETKHWQDMITKPRQAVVQWHRLKPEWFGRGQSAGDAGTSSSDTHTGTRGKKKRLKRRNPLFSRREAYHSTFVFINHSVTTSTAPPWIQKKRSRARESLHLNNRDMHTRIHVQTHTHTLLEQNSFWKAPADRIWVLLEEFTCCRRDQNSYTVVDETGLNSH